MMKTIFTLLVIFISIPVLADGQYACISGETAGLNWERGKWSVSRFTPVNSLISVKSNGERLEHKEAGAEVASILRCNKDNVDKTGYLNCSTSYGKHIVFSESTLQGGISSILGAVMNGASYKDSLYVSTITCQKF